MLRLAPVAMLVKIKRYTGLIIQYDFSIETGPFYIDSRELDASA